MKLVKLLLQIEGLKAKKRLAFWIVLGLFAVLNVVNVLVGLEVASRVPEGSFALPESWPQIMAMPARLGPVFLGILVILLVAPEFSWRTGRQNVIDGLSKERFYAGKLLATALLAFAFVVIPVMIGGIGTIFSPDANESPLVRAKDLSYMFGCGLALLMAGSAALMIACLVRSSGAAMGILAAYMLIEGIVIGTVKRGSETLQTVSEYLPAAVNSAIVDPTVHDPAILHTALGLSESSGTPPVDIHDFEVLIAAVLVYVAVFVTTGFLSMRARDM